MDTATLVREFPRLYHLSWESSWPSIRQHGLLCARDLLELYRVDPERSAELTTQHRPEWVRIACPGLQDAVLRDQKPMSDGGLRRALVDMEPPEWYAVLSSMVFFWPTRARVKTMLSAAAYRGMRHDLIVVDTEKLVGAEEERIWLSAMNSGATRPYPWRRGRETFLRIGDFPFEERKRKAGARGPIAELCVDARVARIKDYVVKVVTVSAEDVDEKW